MIYSNIPGWLTDNEAIELYNLAYNTNTSILEIGFLFGRSTSVICEALRDSNKKIQFDSYDLNFTDSNEFMKFYSKIHGDTITVPELIEEIAFSKNKTIFDIASNILQSYDLLKYVNLNCDNFQNITNKTYGFIFCDVMHDTNEIRINLPKIKELCGHNSLIAIHDTTPMHADIIESGGNLKFSKQVDSIGVFHYYI